MLVIYTVMPLGFLTIGLLMSIDYRKCSGDNGCGILYALMMVFGFIPAGVMWLLYGMAVCSYLNKKKILEIKRDSQLMQELFAFNT